MGRGECAPAITAVHYVYNETIYYTKLVAKRRENANLENCWRVFGARTLLIIVRFS